MGKSDVWVPILIAVVVFGLFVWGAHNQHQASKFKTAALQNASALTALKKGVERNDVIQDTVDDDSRDITRRIVELERRHVQRSFTRNQRFSRPGISDAEMREIDEAMTGGRHEE